MKGEKSLVQSKFTNNSHVLAGDTDSNHTDMDVETIISTMRE